jgi:uncharacterized protein YcbK (DUF882 family)
MFRETFMLALVLLFFIWPLHTHHKATPPLPDSQYVANLSFLQIEEKSFAAFVNDEKYARFEGEQLEVVARSLAQCEVDKDDPAKLDHDTDLLEAEGLKLQAIDVSLHHEYAI